MNPWRSNHFLEKVFIFIFYFPKMPVGSKKTLLVKIKKPLSLIFCIGKKLILLLNLLLIIYNENNLLYCIIIGRGGMSRALHRVQNNFLDPIKEIWAIRPCISIKKWSNDSYLTGSRKLFWIRWRALGARHPTLGGVTLPTTPQSHHHWSVVIRICLDRYNML